MSHTVGADDLQQLEAVLKRLETEYNMFFAGRLQRPPWETRNRVDTLLKECDRANIKSYALRFRLSTLQARYAAFVDLWDRALRAREEGRPGPFSQRPVEPEGHQPPPNRVLYVAAFHDPVHELDKLRDLYHSLAEARREVGMDPVPFHRFADLVKAQVTKMKADGAPEVAFRVAVNNGKVNFTARALKGARP